MGPVAGRVRESACVSRREFVQTLLFVQVAHTSVALCLVCNGPLHTVHSLQNEQFKTPRYLLQATVEGSAKPPLHPLVPPIPSVLELFGFI